MTGIMDEHCKVGYVRQATTSRGTDQAVANPEDMMLFHVAWEFIDTTEAGLRRSLAVFEKWQPPAGADFQGFFGFADGTGGVAIIEADSAATLARTTEPWVPWLRFSVKPIVPVEESVQIGGEAMAFRDSVG